MKAQRHMQILNLFSILLKVWMNVINAFSKQVTLARIRQML